MKDPRVDVLKEYFARMVRLLAKPPHPIERPPSAEEFLAELDKDFEAASTGKKATKP